MNHSTLVRSLAIAVIGFSVALPAFAEGLGVDVKANVNASANTNNARGEFRVGGGMMRNDNRASTSPRMMRGNATSTEARMQNLGDRGETMIQERIKSLQNLSTRIGAMKRLTADQITSLQAALTVEINSLTSLGTTISNDTSTTTLKADVASITKSMRTYMLVMPQAQIAAAADRMLTTVGQLENLAPKLSTRIDAAASAGTDVTALRSALSDLTAKIADAKVQANAAVAETASLKPDNGDATIAASNTAALKDAHTKIQAAQKDIQAAYKDAQTIAKGVKGHNKTATTTPAQ